MAQTLVCAWLAWCVFCIALTLASPYLMAQVTPCTNGFWIVFPKAISDRLTPEQYRAFVAHEQGHIARRHAAKNLLRAFFFMHRTRRMAVMQELEADDYAAARGHGPALASALRATSAEAFDWYRAARLDAR